jgi:hypothetical protein
MTVDEFIEQIVRPEIEADLDARIEAEPDPGVRALLKRYRPVFVAKALDANKVANLEYRLAAAEARLRPHPVD